MARRGYVPRPRSLKDQVQTNQKWAAFYSRDGAAPPLPESLEYLGKPKRVVVKAAVKHDTTLIPEKSVLKLVRAALRKHPNVAFCWREQSGKFTEGNRTINVGFTGKPDLIGMLRNGRFFAIECKNSDGGTQSAEQAYCLSVVRAGGGLAGFASSVDDAIKIIS